MPELYNAEKSPTQTVFPRRHSTEYSQVMRDFPKTHNPFTAFMIRPPMVNFGIREENEKILMVLRRHFITNTRWILFVLLMLLAPLIVTFFPLVPILPEKFSAATWTLWYLLAFGIGLNGLLSWYYNTYIITDERIIDVDFINLIYKNVSFAKIDNIEDVTTQMGGALRNVLNFGTIRVQTAAEKTEFEFEDVPHPQEVSKLINELMIEEEQEQLEGRVS